MKKRVRIFMFLLILILAAQPVIAAQDVTGNGAPSGSHYTLNIIGVAKDKTAEMTGSNGHVIFVPLSGKAKIELFEAPEGESFKVLDANATDGSAIFQLPKPGIDPYLIGGDMEGVDTVTDYSVFVRSLGKPGGWATITTCADLVDSDFAGLLSGKFLSVLNRAGYFGGYASVEQVGQDITMRTKGKSTFTNVTAELLTIVFKVEVELKDESILVEYVRVPIFDEIIDGEYWEYDNKGLKLLQVRFYPVGTDVTYADEPFLPAE
jgi:hypothetical protein